MKHLLPLLLFGISAMAQPRPEKPLPEINERPAATLDRGLTGQSYSLDGQWVSAKMTIPVQAVSTNEEAYESKRNELGLDNIEALQLYRVAYGEENLLMLVKIFRNGHYKYDGIGRKWQKRIGAHYWIFNAREMEKLNDLPSEAAVVKFALRDYGQLADVKPSKIVKRIKKNLIIKPETVRELVFHLKENRGEKTVYFQLAGFNPNEKTVSGVVQDFDRLGNTLYGKPELLQHLYYQLELNAFQRFFQVPLQ